MSKGFKLLRLEYLFTVLIPLFIAIYLNGYDIIDNIEIIGGFAFWAITGNTLNDFKDMDNPNDQETQERIEGYSKKEIAVLSLGSFILGSALFYYPILDNIFLLFYISATALMVVLYCLFLKPILGINWILLGVSHIWFPYFIIKLNVSNSNMLFPTLELFEWFFLSSASLVALSGNIIHEVIDNDAITKLNNRSQQIIIWVVSLSAISISIFSIVLFPLELFLFTPALIIPLGVIYMARSKERLPQNATSIKDIGIITGNLLLAFVVIILF
jgi:hypothetical protein